MASNVLFSGSGLLDAYQAIRRGDPTDWAVWTVATAGPINEAKLVAEGTGLGDLGEQFLDGKAMWAFFRVTDAETQRSRFAIVNWLGEGVPEVKRGLFPQHSAQFAERLAGAHVVIQARTEDDVTPDALIKKVLGTDRSAIASAPKPKTAPVPARRIPSGAPPRPSVAKGPSSTPAAPDDRTTRTARGTSIDRDWSPPKVSAKNTNQVPDLDADEQPVSFAGAAPFSRPTAASAPAPKPTPKPTPTPPISAGIENLNINGNGKKDPNSGVVADAGPAAPVGTTYEPVRISSVGKLKNRWPDLRDQHDAPEPKQRVSSSIRERSAAFQKDGPTATTPAPPPPPAPSAPTKKAPVPDDDFDDAPAAPAPPPPPAPPAPPRPENKAAVPDDDFDDAPAVPAPPPPPAPPAPPRPENKAAVPDDDFDDTPAVPAPPPPPAPPAPPRPENKAAVPDDDFDDTPAVPAPPPPPAPPAPPRPENKAAVPDDDFDDTPAVPAPPPPPAPPAPAAPPAPPAPPAPEVPGAASEPEPAILDHDDGKTVIAIADYEAQADDEISISVNQVIRLVSTFDENWLTGTTLDGQQGNLPAGYVEVLTEGSGAPRPTATALYDYTAAEEGEVSLTQGEPVDDIAFVSQEWWQGTADGLSGLFPAAYVTFFQDI